MKPKKPRAFLVERHKTNSCIAWLDSSCNCVRVNYEIITQNEVRKLAAWLLKAADWMEEK